MSVAWERRLAEGKWGQVMRAKVATLVVEPRFLDGTLGSLTAKSSCSVSCDDRSTKKIRAEAAPDEPKLVVLGAQSVEDAVTKAAAVHKLWPDSKIIVLYEYASLADVQKLLTSGINGCVPPFACSESLIGILDLIATTSAQVMVIPDTELLAMQPPQPKEIQPSSIKVNQVQSDDAEHESASVGIRDSGRSNYGACTASNLVDDLRYVPSLSEREVQILRGLVKGHANKVIARTCDISEATVKVHIKSILRKIRVKNRTQAAIWALESGYAAEAP